MLVNNLSASSLQTVLNGTNPFWRKWMVQDGMGDVNPNHILQVNLQRSYSFRVVTHESKKLVRGPFCVWFSTRLRSSGHPKWNIYTDQECSAETSFCCTECIFTDPRSH